MVMKTPIRASEEALRLLKISEQWLNFFD